MSLYEFIAYIRYRLKAKKLHGIHSPFVYEFQDKCLLENTDLPLKDRLENYFGKENLRWQVGITEMSNEVVIVIPAIHKNKQQTLAWEKMVSNENVLLSIDLFHFGLLVNKKEFKEKQHFVLRY